LHEVPRHPTVIVLGAMAVWLEANARWHHMHPLREFALNLRQKVRVETQLE